jgi:hypothetical protein
MNASDLRAAGAWTVVSAPTNLGLRPPEPRSTPGTAKAPEALREAGLHARLAARPTKVWESGRRPVPVRRRSGHRTVQPRSPSTTALSS